MPNASDQRIPRTPENNNTSKPQSPSSNADSKQEDGRKKSFVFLDRHRQSEPNIAKKEKNHNTNLAGGDEASFESDYDRNSIRIPLELGDSQHQRNFFDANNVLRWNKKRRSSSWNGEVRNDREMELEERRPRSFGSDSRELLDGGSLNNRRLGLSYQRRFE